MQKIVTSKKELVSKATAKKIRKKKKTISTMDAIAKINWFVTCLQDNPEFCKLSLMASISKDSKNI